MPIWQREKFCRTPMAQGVLHCGLVRPIMSITNGGLHNKPQWKTEFRSRHGVIATAVLIGYILLATVAGLWWWYGFLCLEPD